MHVGVWKKYKIHVKKFNFLSSFSFDCYFYFNTSSNINFGKLLYRLVVFFLCIEFVFFSVHY